MTETKETKPSVTLPEATRQPKTVPMKWLELGVAKDPVFGEQYFLFRLEGKEPRYSVGALAGINTVVEGKVYSFYVEHEEDQKSNFTFYAICKPPVE